MGLRTCSMSLARNLTNWLVNHPVNRRYRLGFRVHDLRDRLSAKLRGIPYRELYPNFLIIGAQKSGTTSLHFYLAQHPGIFMTDYKETNLFLEDTETPGPYSSVEPHFYGNSSREKRRQMSDPQILRRMLRGYRGEPMIGDVSPFYTYAPIAGQDVPRKAKRIRPEMRFVYALRNPLERTFSNYLHDQGLLLTVGHSPLDFDTSLARYPHLLHASLYYSQLDLYLQHFTPDCFHVVLLEELSEDPKRVLASLARFLGVRADFAFDTSLLYRASPVGIRRDMREVSRGHYSPASFDKIIGPVREDVAKLEEFLGRDLSLWDLSRGTWCAER